MQTLSGQQFIFTRVEPEYSPTGYGGYQMVYRSPGLPETVVEACESRVKSFHPPDAALVRRQFFTAGQSVVLTHSVEIETIREINDKDRRAGIFLCHGLVFSAATFSEIANNNPFLVFDHFDFLRDSHSMVSHYHQGQQRELPCQIQITSDIPPDNGWLKVAPRMIDLAYQADQLKAGKKILLFLGSEDDITTALRALFHLIPPEVRVACSFDTSIEQVNLAASKYWAGGSARYLAGSDLLANCQTRRLDGYTKEIQDRDMYTTWLNQHLEDPPESIMTLVPAIQAIIRALQKNKPIHPDKIPDAAARSFLSQFRPQIFERIRSYYAGKVSAPLAHALANHLFRITAGASHILSLAALKQLPTSKMCEHIKSWLGGQAPEFAKLSTGDWGSLARLARQEEEPVLQFWTALYAQNYKDGSMALEQMSDSDYDAALRLLLNPFSPQYFVHPKQLSRFIEVFTSLQNRTTDGDFVETVEAILDVGGASHLERLSPRVAALENKYLTDLEKRIQKSGPLPIPFYSAMRQQRQKLGPPPKLFSYLRNRILSEQPSASTTYARKSAKEKNQK